MPKLVYVASSWKNRDLLDTVHKALRHAKFETWDFRHNGFWWEDVEPKFKDHPTGFIKCPQSIEAFNFDKKGLDHCNGVFAVHPCGISTGMEVGYAAGLGKPIVSWGVPRDNHRLDIMWNFADEILHSQEYSLEFAINRLKHLMESW